jgi:hypothetical protein
VWAQHKKVIELNAKKPLEKAVPSSFQYLSVEWLVNDDKKSNKKTDDVCCGLLHVVENEKKIGKYFCLDVVAGLLDVELIRMKKKDNNYNNYEVDSKLVNLLRKSFEQFDWIKYV